MTQLMSKGKIVEEVDKEIKNNTSKQGWHFDEYTEGYLDALKNIKTFLDTLEGKEVDLEKELKLLDNTLFDLDGVAVQGATHYLTVEDVKDIAKHFYELGLKAQKVE